jgi:hypothetical protein
LGNVEVRATITRSVEGLATEGQGKDPGSRNELPML